MVASGQCCSVPALACSPPQVPLLSKAHLLDQSLDVCEGCEGIAAPVGEGCIE